MSSIKRWLCIFNSIQVNQSWLSRLQTLLVLCCLLVTIQLLWTMQVSLRRESAVQGPAWLQQLRWLWSSPYPNNFATMAVPSQATYQNWFCVGIRVLRLTRPQLNQCLDFRWLWHHEPFQAWSTQNAKVSSADFQRLRPRRFGVAEVATAWSQRKPKLGMVQGPNY